MCLLILLFVFCTACKNGPEIRAESLHGRWDIEKAEKNGRETTYLRGGYFIIGNNGTMTVNITGEAETGSYLLERSKLKFAGSKEFVIEAPDADSMLIRYTSSSDVIFLFHLVRHHDEEQ